MARKIITEMTCPRCGGMFSPSPYQRKPSHKNEKHYCGLCRYGGTLLERFMANIRQLPNGCLEWIGSINDRGYGYMKARGKSRFAHHVAFFLKYGYWPPEGYEIDHVCHPNTCLLGKKCPHRRCVNWEHLKLLVRHTGGNNSAERSAAGTIASAMNLARGRARSAAMTACKHDHPRTSDNVYTDPKTGWKCCRECGRIRMQKHRLRKGLQSTTAAVLITSPPV